MVEICIGTVQFGLNYGATNRQGQVGREEVGNIIRTCIELNIDTFDCAQSYGNAEAVLGESLNDTKRAKLITKLKPISEARITEECIRRCEEELKQSLIRLRTNRLECLMIHRSQDLRKQGAERLLDWLVRCKLDGRVNKLGVSIYDREELIGLDKRVQDAIQLPLSLYDQRFLRDGTIERLFLSGTDIFARSIYLQGLIVTPSEEWPPGINVNLKRHHESLERHVVSTDSSALEMAVGFIAAQRHLSHAVVGVCNREQLLLLKRAWDRCIDNKTCYAQWDYSLREGLDPRTWKTS